MKSYTKYILFIVFTSHATVQTGASVQLNNFANNNNVNHKDSQLNLYLDLIQYNTHEKLGILPYVLQSNNNEIFLEIGTGGDPIASLFSNIPHDLSITIIASDIEQNILNALPKRHQSLIPYIENKNIGPKLVLQQLDGTNMHCFKDNYLAGINASAVVHEIISYAGGFQGLNNFFSESFRVLKENGVLIYRDPEGVINKNEFIKMRLNNPSIRLFTHVFIPKFLDMTCSKLAKSGKKSDKYSTHDITITYYNRNDSTPTQSSYDDYFKTPTHNIDFSREHTFILPRGLCREIERHYLTYLHQCNSLSFATYQPTIDSNLYLVNYLAHSTQSIFLNFLEQNGLSIKNNYIDIATKKAVDLAIAANTQPIEFGLPIHFSSELKRKQFTTLIKNHGFNPNLYIIQTKNKDILLDYRIFGLLHETLDDQIFDEINKPTCVDDSSHAQWLKREGEETYIYYSDDELITEVAKISLALNKNDESFILCPISSELNFFIPRICYEELLNSSMNIYDLSGHAIEIKEGKRVIHFTKISAKQAIPIFLDIIKTNPERYLNLNNFIKKLSVN